MPVYGLEWLVATFQWQILARLADKAFKVYMPHICIIYEIRLLIGLRRESIRARKPFLLHHLGKSEIQTSTCAKIAAMANEENAGVPLCCSVCQKEGDSSEIKQCSVCGTTRYCGVDCQKSDWSIHKKTCTTAAFVALLAAIGRNDAVSVRKLARVKRVLNARIDHKKEPDSDGNVKTLQKWTALHECVSQGNAEMIRLLLEQEECDVDILDVDGETPLFVACSISSDMLPVIQHLLDAGADPNSQAKDGWNCLMMAVRAGHADVVQALLDHGADIHAYGGGFFGRPPLDMIDQLVTGQGIRKAHDESWDHAKERYAQVYNVMQQYA
jgi:Ankyrin repeats (3 copies)/MYND finger